MGVEKQLLALQSFASPRVSATGLCLLRDVDRRQAGRLSTLNFQVTTPVSAAGLQALHHEAYLDSVPSATPATSSLPAWATPLADPESATPKFKAFLLNWLRRAWRGHQPEKVAYSWFTPAEVQRLHQALVSSASGTFSTLDDATWRDLELGRYLDALACNTSLFGRQLLLHKLRASTLEAPEERLVHRLGHCSPKNVADDELAPIRAALEPLQTVDIDVAGLLFADPLPSAPAWVGHLWAVPVALVGVAALTALGMWAAAVVLGVAAVVVSGAAQIALHGALLQWQRQRRALVVLLSASRHSAAAGVDSVLLQQVRLHSAPTRALLSAFRVNWVDRMPGIAEYANLVALTQYRQWARDLSRLPAQRDDLQRIFLAVAGLEADLTLCEHLRHGPATCPAEPASGLHLAFTELTHPLLDQPHPLSLQLNGQGAFITGQNGVGKSTLLRSVGLNVIVGQAFGFCYSRQALVPRVQVCSSLQIEDSLGTATSLYMAELERARWLCKVAQLPGGSLLLIDEIFRGTNPEESMAATLALALELATTSLVMMASHHRQLASWLVPSLQPYCVTADSEGALFLRAGVLERTNGLAMLAEYGFSIEMRAVAERFFDTLHTTRDRR
jgi:hypothetical protein